MKDTMRGGSEKTEKENGIPEVNQEAQPVRERDDEEDGAVSTTITTTAVELNWTELIPMPMALPLPALDPAALDGAPSAPGAYAVFSALRYFAEQNGSPTEDEGLEMVEQPTLQDSGLVQAHPVSYPVAIATPQQRTENITHTGKRRWAAVLATVMVGLMLIIAFSTIIPSFLGRDPKQMEHMQIKATILDAFGDQYFDNPLKERALHWMMYEDPRTGALKIKEQSHHPTNLIQRYSLVSFYFQTSFQHPWKYCNPPVGKQSEICFYTEGKQDVRGTRWLTATHECQWMGVSCDQGTKSITEIVLRDNDMTGSIPAYEIAMLTHLRRLRLRSNKLSGSLPRALFGGTTVQGIALDGNHLSGEIPPEAFLMPSLQSLALGHNQFSGSIPSEIGQFGEDTVRLQPNLLTGYTVGLQNNMLTGSIPEELYGATRLSRLMLKENLLTGRLSPAVGSMTELIVLRIGGNPISASIPSEIGLLRRLSSFSLQGSRMKGHIPDELYSCLRLKYLSLNDIQISGTISTRVGLLQNLEEFNFANTYIRGPLPKELGLLPNLEELYINGNGNLTGSIPGKLCSHLIQNANIVADCTPSVSSGVPRMSCPKGCCSTCCDAETKICLEQ